MKKNKNNNHVSIRFGNSNHFPFRTNFPFSRNILLCLINIEKIFVPLMKYKNCRSDSFLILFLREKKNE